MIDDNIKLNLSVRKRDDGQWVCEYVVKDGIYFHSGDTPVEAVRKTIEFIESYDGPVVNAEIIRL